MITLNHFKLRPIEGSDLDWIRVLRNNESTWSQLGTFIFLYEVTQKDWFENLKHREDREYLVFTLKNKPLGIVRLTEIDKTNRSMCVGGDIIPRYRGKGYAYPMYQLIFKLAFDVLGMNRLWLLVLETNKRAIHIYKKLGFKNEGRQREAIYRNGRFNDYIMMSILAREYYYGKKKLPSDI